MLEPSVRKDLRALVVLVPVAAGIFLAACAIFRFPFATGLDVLWLVGLTLLPGTLLVLLARQLFSLELAAPEILSLGSAVGFGIPPLLLGALHAIGISHPVTLYYIFRSAATVTVFTLLVRRKLRLGFDGQLRAINDLWIFAIGALLFFALYNLSQFHYRLDGSLVTHGLFGVDLPFLAGQVHGLQDFGSLRDLHQLAQPWHYHDWTYQLLALLPRERTLPALALAAPLVGYALLAFSIFALVLRFTKSRYIAYVSVALWFLVSGLEGGEVSSYALSPSFVFGTMIFLNILLVLDLRAKEPRRKNQWFFSALLLYLFIQLSQTKLSSFLVIAGGLGLMGLIGLIFLQQKRRLGVEALLITGLALGVVLWQTAGTNPLMPSGDFLIGAPLLGYANHLSAMLHVPVASVNPISCGLHLHWQSLLIIPFFVFHFLRFAILDPKILSAIIVLLVFRKLLWGEFPEIVWLLVLLIPLGFLLPVLYSPAWYPLALSFYAPLVSVQAAFLLVAMGFGVLARQHVGRGTKAGMGLVGLISLIGIALQGHTIMKADTSAASATPSALVEAMNYFATSTNDSAIIATHRFDFAAAKDESYYWYSALSGRTVVSEGAKYGSLLAAVADTNSEKGLHWVPAARDLLLARRALLDTIFTSRDSADVNAAITKAKVSYVLEDESDGHALSQIYQSRIGKPVFFNKLDTIWKVR